jgi:hypothetical protein
MNALHEPPVQTASEAHRAQREEVLRVLSELPQARVIVPSDAAKWIDRVFEVEPSRARWHALRARGIGGSEMGAVVSAMRGEFHPFTSGEKIARQKLLMEAPEPPSGDTERGVFTEDINREKTRALMAERYGARPADDLLEAIAEIETGGDRPNPWQVGNPDDMFYMPNGELMVLDYKCPKPGKIKEYEHFGISSDYVVQLHHYSMLAREKGADPRRLMLASFDCGTWAPVLHEIPFSEALIEEIGRAGNRFWNDFILAGKVPASVEKPVVSGEALPEDIVETVRRASMVMSVASAAYKESRDLQELLSSRIGDGLYLDAPSMSIGHADVIAQPKVDEAKVKRLFELWGEDLEQYRMMADPDIDKMTKRLIQIGDNVKDYYQTGDLDPAAISERLKKARRNPGDFIVQSVTVKLTKERRGPRGKEFVAIREKAIEAIDVFAKDRLAALNASRTPRQEGAPDPMGEVDRSGGARRPPRP